MLTRVLCLSVVLVLVACAAARSDPSPHGRILGKDRATFGVYHVGLSPGVSLQPRDVVLLFHNGRYIGEAIVVSSRGQRARVLPRHRDPMVGDTVTFARRSAAVMNISSGTGASQTVTSSSTPGSVGPQSSLFRPPFVIGTNALDTYGGYTNGVINPNPPPGY